MLGGLEDRPTGIRADLAKLLRNNKIGPELPKQFAVDPLQEVTVGTVLLDYCVYLVAIQANDLPQAAADHRFGSRSVRIVAGV